MKITISEEEFHQKLNALAEENWKVKSILRDTDFDNLSSRMQSRILNLLGLGRALISI